jgi:putative hydrolase of the HAD superfamily
MTAVTFDFGQTLAELDVEMLSRRVAERGAELDPARASAASSVAWAAYGDAKRRGLVAREAWCTFMATLLTESGLQSADAGLLADWLFDQQPSQNLWRRPIAGMFELVRELFDAGVPLGIVSNSEGKLSELCAELGIRSMFTAFADSGVLGIEKPDRRIFEHTAAGLGVAPSELVHVGDAWEADVVGALGVGARAIWFAPTDDRVLPEGVRSARDAGELRAALSGWGVLHP